MQGNITTAARWLGASIVLSSVILVVGFSRGPTGGLPPGAIPARSEPVRRDPGIPAGSSAASQPPAPFVPARVAALLDEAERLRQDGEDLDRSRFWFLDRPSRMTPFRTHGGLGP